MLGVSSALVLISAFVQEPMTLVFLNPLHLLALASTVSIFSAVAREGDWFEAQLLSGVYGLFGLNFFFAGPA